MLPFADSDLQESTRTKPFRQVYKCTAEPKSDFG